MSARPRIISASRRTDIPALYPAWFANRVRAGWCAVPGPLNPRQVSRVSLDPADVDAVVFWTRFVRPLAPYFEEIEARPLPFYVLHTVVDYPRAIQPRAPATAAAIEGFRQAARRIGPGRMVWRYDPIVVTPRFDFAWHLERFARIARALAGSTKLVKVSFYDAYRKTARRMDPHRPLSKDDLVRDPGLPHFLNRLSDIASGHGMAIQSCAETLDLAGYGIPPGKCIDDALLARELGVTVPPAPDKSQRAACGCVASRDIGMYDTCVFGCDYCYATANFERARAARATHDPASPSLAGWHEPTTGTAAPACRQGSLFDE
jgi:hypothetical protein